VVQIIYLGQPDGPTCHTGAETCYYTSVPQVCIRFSLYLSVYFTQAESGNGACSGFKRGFRIFQKLCLGVKALIVGVRFLLCMVLFKLDLRGV